MMLQDRLVHTILKMGYVLHQLINPLFLKLEVLIGNNKILWLNLFMRNMFFKIVLYNYSYKNIDFSELKP